MAKIKFDEVGKRLYETGVEQVVLFPMNTNGTYAKGVGWNGVTSIEESPEGGEETKLWADDIAYLSLRSKEQFKATINAYTYPDEWAECDGSKAAIPGMILHQQTRKPFGLAYITKIGNDTEFEDHGFKLHFIYNATAAVSSKTHSTINDSPEATEMSWELSSNPIEAGFTVTGVTLKDLSTIEIDSTAFPDETTGGMNAKLKSLIDWVYGTDPATEGADGTDPAMPSPAKIHELLTATTNANKVVNTPKFVANNNK